MNLFEARNMITAEAEAIRSIRLEPTKEQNEFANRNHPAKLESFDLNLKDARSGLYQGDSYQVVAFDFVMQKHYQVAVFYFIDSVSQLRARMLSETLARNINNG